MELLNTIQRDTLDPEYAEHAAGRRSGPSRAPVLLLVVCVLAGLMFTTSGLGAGRGTDTVASERADLIARIAQADQRNREVRGQVDQLTAEIEALEQTRLGAEYQIDTGVAVWSGAGAVSGPGVLLTITDNPLDANGIIVDQDLRQVVNGLWLAGAEAMAINGHRLSARTAIRQAGSAVTVDYRSMTTPYRVEAIGDPDQLTLGLTDNSGGAWLAFLKGNYGVKWTLERRAELQLGADAGLGVKQAGVP